MSSTNSSTNSSVSSNGKNRLSMRLSMSHHHANTNNAIANGDMTPISESEDALRISYDKFPEEIVKCANDSLNKLSVIWKDAGYEEIECHRLLGDIFTKINNLLLHEITAEEQILNHAKQEIEATIQDIVGMNAQLGRTGDFSYLSKMHCSDQLTELETILQQVTTDFNQRQSLLDQELAKVHDICNELGEECPNADFFRGPENTPILSDARLNLMKNYQQEMNQLRTRRTDDLMKVAKDCVAAMLDMKFIEEGMNNMIIGKEKIDITLDKQLVSFVTSADVSSKTLFTVHKSDLVKISNRLNELLEEKEKRRVELAVTGEEIAKLWSLLRIPAEEREAFTHSFERNLSMQTLQVGYEEVERLREIKRQSFGVIINSLRQDIMTLWEEIGINTHEQREREFPIYFTDVVHLEEDAVDVHENYCKKIKAKVEELKPILGKVNKRELIVQERIELEHIQMNSERLTARGPNAREERKREEAMANRVKGLEKLTKELLTTIVTWEEINGPFIYSGERYVDRVVHQDEHFIEVRDNLRNSRKKNNNSNNNNATMGGNTSMLNTSSSSALNNSFNSSGGKKTTTSSSAGSTPVKNASASNLNKINASANANKSHAAMLTMLSSNNNTTKKPVVTTTSNSKIIAAAVNNAATGINENTTPNVYGIDRRDSDDGTIYTSATEVKDRGSISSHTIVQLPTML